MAELKSLGRYTIERVLGKGAMGVVYEAVDPRLNRRVAIKTILRSSLDEATAQNFAARFVQEAQAVARLEEAKKREADLKKSKEREAQLLREAELARQREAEALKQAELNKRREAEVAKLQAKQAADQVAAEKARAEQTRAAPKAPAVAASPLPAPSTPPARRFPQAGDSYTYQFIDLDKRDQARQAYSVTVTSATAEVIEEEVVTRGARLQWKHGKGNYLVNLGASVFSPYLTAFAPVFPGSALTPIINHDPSTCQMGWHCVFEARVLGNERVQVPAGAFDAAKVEFHQSWAGGSRGGEGVGSRVLTVWYSTETRRAVKFASRERISRGGGTTGSFDLELASFQLK